MTRTVDEKKSSVFVFTLGLVPFWLHFVSTCMLEAQFFLFKKPGNLETWKPGKVSRTKDSILNLK